MYAYIDGYTLTHMLGYLTPKQWADALSIDSDDLPLNYNDIWKLIRIQEEVYNFNLKDDVRKELEEE